MIVTVSVDTEEDNWRPARNGITVENIRELPRLDAFLRQFGVRATYFTTYQVVICPWASEILQEVQASGHAEIGAHLHPWNTPPIEEEFTPRHTMLKNLSGDLQFAKLSTLTEAMLRTFGNRPMAFRAGRYALGPETVTALIDSGYRIDSSVTPFFSWEEIDDGPCFIGAPLDAYRLGRGGDVRVPCPNGSLIEFPISCGYSRRPFEFWSAVHEFITLPPLRPLRLAGIAYRTRLLRRIFLSPETHPTVNLLILSRQLIDRGHRYLHLCWHSPSMRAGLSEFTATAGDVERLYASIGQYLEKLAAMTSIQFLTVTEAAETLAPKPR